MRFEDRSAEPTASCSSSVPGSEASRSWSNSRLARMLVSGVRSSCDASATNSRCNCIICSVSDRAASSSRSIWSSVRASSPTSSSRSGSGIRCEGSRVVAIERAVLVSVAIGRMARPAMAMPASAARAVPPRTPSARNSHRRLMVPLRLSVLRAYWRSALRSTPFTVIGTRVVYTRSEPMSVKPGTLSGSGPRFGALKPGADLNGRPCWSTNRAVAPASMLGVAGCRPAALSWSSRTVWLVASRSSSLKLPWRRFDVSRPTTRAKMTRMRNVRTAETAVRRQRTGQRFGVSAATSRSSLFIAGRPHYVPGAALGVQDSRLAPRLELAPHV